MTMLNARANQAYQALVDELEAEDQVLEFSSTQGAFEEGWETGYKTAQAEAAEESMTNADDVTPSLGITYRQFAVLCAKATENLPTDTTVTFDDIDAILTWVLPDYREMLSPGGGGVTK